MAKITLQRLLFFLKDFVLNKNQHLQKITSLLLSSRKDVFGQGDRFSV